MRAADLGLRAAGKLLPAAVVITAGFLVGAAPARAVTGCITKSCHAAIAEGSFLHGPIAGGMCPICHSAGAAPTKPLPAGHPAVGTDAGRAVCLECHEEIRALLQQAHVHTPVADGACIDCHSPHRSENSLFLKFPPTEEKGKRRIAGSCNACHKPESAAWFDEFHAGEAILDCTVCHNAHAAAEQYQLTGYVRNIFLQATIADGAEHLRTGDVDAGIAAYRKALTLNPADDDSRLVVGRVYLAQERWQEAGREFDSILTRLPGHVDALVGAAAVATHLSGPYAGLKFLLRAAETSPQRPDIHLELGIAYRKLGQIQQALGEVSRAVELDPALAEAHLQLSQLQESLGHPEEAKRSLGNYRRLTGKP
jgi:predicted CXXCH cytochrome family protein